MSPLANSLRDLGFADAADFVEQTTYAIWNGEKREPDLILRYYTADTPIHMDGGDIVGARAVLTNTQERLVSFPDFHGVIDDTIWTGDEERGYRTSMRWTWSGTNLGPSVFGPPTARRVRLTAIANCIIRAGQYVEEWLANNQLALAVQLGLDQEHALERWTAARPAAGRPTRPSPPSIHGPGALVADLLDDLFTRRPDGAAEMRYHPAAIVRIGPDRRLRPSEVRGWIASWAGHLPGARHEIHDQYWCDDGEGTARVATQWTLTWRRDGAPASVTGISHHRVQSGQVVAEWTELDELALFRHL